MLVMIQLEDCEFELLAIINEGFGSSQALAVIMHPEECRTSSRIDALQRRRSVVDFEGAISRSMDDACFQILLEIIV